jgi:hypothetical protein
MIRLIDEREKVSTFWHGLRQSIQRALWQDRYNPETSSWAEVKDAAQIIEVSEHVGGDNREHRSNRQSGTGDGKFLVAIEDFNRGKIMAMIKDRAGVISKRMIGALGTTLIDEIIKKSVDQEKKQMTYHLS